MLMVIANIMVIVARVCTALNIVSHLATSKAIAVAMLSAVHQKVVSLGSFNAWA